MRIMRVLGYAKRVTTRSAINVRMERTIKAEASSKDTL
jgi:hypothetical protein